MPVLYASPFLLGPVHYNTNMSKEFPGQSPMDATRQRSELIPGRETRGMTLGLNIILFKYMLNLSLIPQRLPWSDREDYILCRLCRAKIMNWRLVSFSSQYFNWCLVWTLRKDQTPRDLQLASTEVSNSCSLDQELDALTKELANRLL